jgi:hypothetical protein
VISKKLERVAMPVESASALMLPRMLVELEAVPLRDTASAVPEAPAKVTAAVMLEVPPLLELNWLSTSPRLFCPWANACELQTSRNWTVPLAGTI